MEKPQKILTMLFVLTMILLSSFSIRQWIPIASDNTLNGVYNPAPEPVLTWNSYRTTDFQTQTERYLSEHYGFRKSLIRLYNQFLYDFFRKTYSEEVVIGKDYWCYYKQHVNEYYGTEMYRWYDSKEEACADFDREARLMWKLRGVLKDYGIEFLMFMAPDKGFLYPEHLPDREFDTTTVNAREYYSTKFDEYNFPYIEMTKWFLELKETDTLPYSLMPQAGAHWGFSAVLAADSLFRFMGNLNGQRFPEMKIGPLHESSRQIKTGDRDLENILNLMRVLPHRYDKLLDAEVTIVKDSATIWPSVLFVGNSFLWRMHDFIPFDDMFSHSEYWFYNSTANFGKNYLQTASVGDLDILQKLLDFDYVVWFTEGNQMYKTSYMFVESALLSLCIDEDRIKNTQYYLIDSLFHDSLTSIKTKQMDDVQRNNYIWTNANQILRKNLEQYFPELAGDSIPSTRNPRICEVLTIKKIKNDPQWIRSLQYQSYLQNLPLNDLLKVEAQNVLNDKPIMRDLNEAIPRDALLEILVRDMMEEMRNKPILMEQVQQKVMKNGKTIEEQLQIDARWIIHDKIEKGEIVWSE